jgi:hypothetical protein
VLNISFAALFLARDIPTVFPSMLAVPNIGLESAMACHVYRAVTLRVIKNPQSMDSGSTMRSTSVPEGSGHERAFKRPTVDDESHNVQAYVDINEAVNVDTKVQDVKVK